MADSVINSAKEKMEEALLHLDDELSKLRTGRAHPSMLNNISIEAYGAQTPLKHAATISNLDATTLQISPFDPSNLEAISTSIREDQSLGLNPSDDGKVVRVSIPPMTTERREEVVKQLKIKVEDANISLRNARHDSLKDSKKQLSDKEITEDDYRDDEKKLNDLIDEYKSKIDALAKEKEQEIMTI